MVYHLIHDDEEIIVTLAVLCNTHYIGRYKYRDRKHYWFLNILYYIRNLDRPVNNFIICYRIEGLTLPIATKLFAFAFLCRYRSMNK